MSDFTLSLSEPTITQETLADGSPKIHVSFHVTNNGTERVDDGRLTITIKAMAEGITETEAELEFPLAGLDAGASAQHGGPLQIDPGSWDVIVLINDPQTFGVVANTEPQKVHIAGREGHTPAFAENDAYDITPQITSVEKLSGSTIRVHYTITNVGKVAVPPGLEVYAYVNDEVRNMNSDQDYHLQRGVAVGATDPHYLTLEGETDPGTTWKATVWVDPNGPSLSVAMVNVTWDEHGRASIAPV